MKYIKKEILSFVKKFNLSKIYFSKDKNMIIKGISIGLFWGFIPMPGQMLGVIFTTFIFRFNVLVALMVVWFSNPITYPFVFYVEYLTGSFLLNKKHLSNIELNTEWFVEHWNEIIISLYTGAFFYSIVSSLFVYFVFKIFYK